MFSQVIPAKKANLIAMKKTFLLLLLISIVFVSSGCLLTNLVHRPTLIEETDQPYSDFTAWKKGNITEIPIDAGKDSLLNYREHLQILFTGKDETGTPLNYSQEYLVEEDRPRDAHREVETLQTTDQYMNGTNELVTMGGFTYSIQNRQGSGLICEKTPYDPNLGKLTLHTHIIEGFSPGKLVEENVQVNGVSADIYEINTVPLLFRNEMKLVSGKVWIASGTPYFLKAEGTLEGGFWFDTTFATGSATFTYEITQQGQMNIQVPDLCANLPVDLFPLPDNATEVDKSSPFFITFSSLDSREQIINFYLTGLTSAGWSVEEQPTDSYPLVLHTSTTTPQGMLISAEIQVNAMSEGSYVVINWTVK
jgi:hypothetical protein